MDCVLGKMKEIKDILTSLKKSKIPSHEVTSEMVRNKDILPVIHTIARIEKEYLTTGNDD